MKPFFYMSIHAMSRDFVNVNDCITQGIDAHLEGFTHSLFEFRESDPHKLYCEFDTCQQFQIMIRRLLALQNEAAEMLADDMIYAKYDYEVI